MTASPALAMPANIVEALSRQVARVAVIRERYACLDGMPHVNIQPLMFMIDEALETAHRAAASGDTPLIIRSLRDLEDFEDFDK